MTWGGFALSEGAHVPPQSSPTSCGAACLVLARMLIDPGYAQWIVGESGEPAAASAVSTVGDAGVGTGAAGAGGADAQLERWRQAQTEVVRRTNAVGRYPGLLQAPWPANLGTPPWGARAELERSCSLPGVSYEVRMVRFHSDAALGSVFDGTLARVGVGRPVLCYVGSDMMPRHIVLWLRTEPDAPVLQYDPVDGSLTRPVRAAFVGRRMGSAGWDMPWLLLRPDPVVLASELSRLASRLSAPLAQPLTRFPGPTPA